MKKKIKDLTFAETKRICNNTLRCSICPLFSTEENILCVLSEPLILATSTYWESEIEIPKEPVGNTDQLEEELISKSELLAKLEELEENTRNISRTIKPNTPAKHNYHGRMKMIDIIITGILEDWGEEPEPDIPADYFRPM